MDSISLSEQYNKAVKKIVESNKNDTETIEKEIAALNHRYKLAAVYLWIFAMLLIGCMCLCGNG